MIAIRDLEMTKERLLSFAEYAKDAQPEVLVTLIQTIVERIYIVDKDDERFCHIFIKGCTDEDYTGFFQTAGYIEQNTTPVCDSEQYCISIMEFVFLYSFQITCRKQEAVNRGWITFNFRINHRRINIGRYLLSLHQSAEIIGRFVIRFRNNLTDNTIISRGLPVSFC